MREVIQIMTSLSSEEEWDQRRCEELARVHITKGQFLCCQLHSVVQRLPVGGHVGRLLEETANWIRTTNYMLEWDDSKIDEPPMHLPPVQMAELLSNEDFASPLVNTK